MQKVQPKLNTRKGDLVITYFSQEEVQFKRNKLVYPPKVGRCLIKQCKARKNKAAMNYILLIPIRKDDARVMNFISYNTIFIITKKIH